jgi:hypothetical protein
VESGYAAITENAVDTDYFPHGYYTDDQHAISLDEIGSSRNDVRQARGNDDGA